MPRYAIIQAPSALGHVPEHLGVERASGVLLGAELADGLDARWAGPVAAEGYSPLPDPATGVMNPGAEAAARDATAHLTRDHGPKGGFWIHVDADVLDESLMQAVDDPRPGGLAWDELTVVLRTALASGRAVGLQLAIYNPDFDPDATNGRGLAAAVRKALT